ncbi:hypothetical protein RU07_21840 [Agrobacterium tumefaciens]|uniref:Uncharacterized protein n=1 Tax=Agrobacterium tumefaciens TaxID=358 RepID=A0A0D0KQT1_AGRTU|nr:hypothetical protein RU07_21840 [Agrobacterium tumefaciens]
MALHLQDAPHLPELRRRNDIILDMTRDELLYRLGVLEGSFLCMTGELAPSDGMPGGEEADFLADGAA